MSTHDVNASNETNTQGGNQQVNGDESIGEKAIPGNDNQRGLKKQRWVMGVAIAGVALVAIALFAVKPKGAPAPTAVPQENAFDGSATVGDTNAQWVYVAEEKVTQQGKQLVGLAEQVKTNEDKRVSQQATIDLQQQTIDALKADIDALKSSTNAKAISDEPEVLAPPPKPRPTLITRKWTRPKKPIAKTPETFVPATSFAKGVLLNGVDASTGVTSQGDPKPVTLRLVDRGSLPNGKRSHLKGCRVLGVAHGEISSERALIRLSKLSCWQLGEYREFPIKGYVTGHDGKPGIRGRVVMRDGAAVSRAFVGGFVGGLAKSASNSLTFQSVSPEGSVSSVKSGDAFRYAGADGVSDGLSMYAKYQIKRAEQYQPVIEVGSGIAVDVVFTEGFYLDGFKLSASGSRENAEADFDASPANNTAEPKPFLQLPTRGGDS